jgi:uncharacterized membrane protein YgcG
MVALVLIGPLAIHSLGSLGSAIETLLLVLVIFLAALFVLVATIAVFPVGDQSTPTKIVAARQAQRNARTSLILLVGISVVMMLAVYFSVVPIWETLQFQFAYQRLKWGAIDLPTFFTEASLSQVAGEAVTQSTITDLDETELPFTMDGRITDTEDLLRRIAGRHDAVISGSVKITTVGVRHVALVAAERITLSRDSSLEIGSASLVLLAGDIVIEPGASIRAYAPDDIPSNAGLDFSAKGKGGAPSGDLRIVILNSISGTGSASLDLRGQRGGPGAPGAVPAQKQRRDDAIPLPGRPRWGFRPLAPDKLNKIQEEFGRERPFLSLSPELSALANESVRTLQFCREKPNSCVAIDCFEDPGIWDREAQGADGETGYPGGKGGPGGDSGGAGSVAIFYSSSAQFSPDQIESKFKGPNGTSIRSPSQRRSGGRPGEGGKGGPGGIGGRGLAGDPFGACPSGKAGAEGLDGAQGDLGDPGAETQGPDLKLVRLTPLFARPRAKLR